ncbi:MAG: hypothetical protein AB1726_17685 [Planctomycetota bacterium]
MAITRLEVYRRFTGPRRRHPLRFWPITAANVRAASKRKLPLLLLYAIPAIGTAIFSFFVYAKFAAEARLLPDGAGGGLALVDMLAQRALQRLEVRNNIAEFNSYSQTFALLPAAWFGSALFAADIRAGAHQLYFCRPITRLDYFLGKFLTAAFFTACAVLVPGLVICAVAAFNSPDWYFLLEEWDVIVDTVLYSLVWIVVTSSVALAVSSLAARRSFAIVGFFAVFFIPHAMGRVLRSLEGYDFFAISPIYDLRQVAIEIFDLGHSWPGIPAATAWSVLAGTVAASLLVVALRLRRLEAVG